MVAAERLQSLAVSPGPYAGWAQSFAPYWSPPPEAVATCDRLITRSFAGRERTRYVESLVQLAGLSLEGKHVLLVQSLCPELQEREARSNPDFRDLVRLEGDELRGTGCGCYLKAFCDPEERKLRHLGFGYGLAHCGR